MYAQLGNIIFQGLLGFDTLDFEGDEAVYAEFPLINGKPRLQKTGETLQDIAITIKFHAEFCNPSEQIARLKEAKSLGEIMPLLMGNGKYIADFVIISFPYTVDETFADGTIIQATVSLMIKEYIASNKIEKKEQVGKANAFAVGDKKPFLLRPQPPVKLSTSVANNITISNQQASKINGLVSEVENNPSSIEKTAIFLKQSSDKAVKAISDINTELENANEVRAKYTALKAGLTTVKSAFTGISNLFPFDSITDLKSSNEYLQNVIRKSAEVTTPIFKDLITRIDD